VSIKARFYKHSNTRYGVHKILCGDAHYSVLFLAGLLLSCKCP